jgi:hypothetical protein
MSRERGRCISRPASSALPGRAVEDEDDDEAANRDESDPESREGDVEALRPRPRVSGESRALFISLPSMVARAGDALEDNEEEDAVGRKS